MIREIPATEIEKALIKLSEVMVDFRSTRLTERAIVVLLQDRTGLSKKVIGEVLSGLGDLEKLYLKKQE